MPTGFFQFKPPDDDRKWSREEKKILVVLDWLEQLIRRLRDRLRRKH